MLKNILISTNTENINLQSLFIRLLYDVLSTAEIIRNQMRHGRMNVNGESGRVWEEAVMIF
jgi:hypothetical protein